MLARYRAWSTHRDALSAAENDPSASVSATEWQASDDEAAELTRSLARLLSNTHQNAGADLVGRVAR